MTKYIKAYSTNGGPVRSHKVGVIDTTGLTARQSLEAAISFSNKQSVVLQRTSRPTYESIRMRFMKLMQTPDWQQQYVIATQENLYEAAKRVCTSVVRYSQLLTNKLLNRGYNIELNGEELALLDLQAKRFDEYTKLMVILTEHNADEVCRFVEAYQKGSRDVFKLLEQLQ